MLPEDVSQIVSALKESQKPDEKSRIIDYLFKALIAVIVWIVVGVQKDVDDLKVNVQTLSNDKIYSERDMEAFKQFIEKPRFTKEDFDAQIQPLINNLNKNTLELNTRSAFFVDIEKRLIKLEYRVDELEE